MAKLIYSMITSMDGYAEAAEGDLGTGADDPEVHTFVGDVFRRVGTAGTNRSGRCPRSGSNRHLDPFKGPASADWATGASCAR